MLEFIAIDIVIISFFLELIDIYAGMGFGVITPFLILMGYHPHNIVPAVLFLSAIFGLSAALFHHFFKNIDFKDIKIKKTVSVIIFLGFFGILAGAFLSTHLSEKVLEIYIGIIIITMGLFLLLNNQPKIISWYKLSVLSAFAGFNKGMTGGGYGPLLTSGQILSGIRSKKAVSITSFAEGVVSLAGFLFFCFYARSFLDWRLILSMFIGGGAAIIPAVYLVKTTKALHLQVIIGLISILLGLLTLGNSFIHT